MQIAKKYIALTLCLVTVLLCMIGSASASSEIDVYSSNYILSCNATLSSSGNGKLTITASERTNGTMSTLGVSAIRIYKADGTYVTRILGSSSNGLLKKNGTSFNGSYTYQGSSGTSYYVVVTFTASNSSGSDTRMITTATKTA